MFNPKTFRGIGHLIAPLTFVLFALQTNAAESCGIPQDRINAAAAGSTLDLTGCTYSGTIRITKPLRLVGLTLNSPANASAVTVTADDVILERLTLRGPQSTKFDANAIGISANGTATRPVRKLQILDSKVSRFGNAGMSLNYIYNAQVLRNLVEDTVYSGIIALSAKGGLIQGNIVRRIGVYGSSENYGNAYGIAISQQSPPMDPQSTDVIVDFNLVEDVPTWHGLDTHAGIRIKFTRNTVRRCQDAIYITGDDSYRRSLDVIVEGNNILAPQGADQFGITSVYSTGGFIRNNNIVGYPSGHTTLTTSDGDDEATARNISLSGNTTNSSSTIPVPTGPAPLPVSAPAVSLSSSTATPGQVLTVNVSGDGKSTLNWIALYEANSLDSDLGYQGNWQFLNGLHTAPSSPIQTASLKITAPLQPGVYNVRLFAIDDSSQRLAISSSITVVQPADTSAPITTVTSPAHGSKVPKNRQVSIQAAASDNVGVQKVEFYVNGNLKCSATVAPYRCNWQVPRGIGKTYHLRTRAYDAAGNIGISNIVKVISK